MSPGATVTNLALSEGADSYSFPLNSFRIGIEASGLRIHLRLPGRVEAHETSDENGDIHSAAHSFENRK
jgi:hypothetical protein